MTPAKGDTHSDADLVELTRRNPGLQFERSAAGELIVTPTGSKAGRRELVLGAQLDRKTKAEIERLLGLPWTVELRRNHDGTFFARVVELRGCMTEGAEEHKALRNLRKAQELWLVTEVARGASIPEPGPAHQYSGKFTVRTSSLVHRLAAETAKRLGVSLNEFANEALALAAGASGAVPDANGTAGRKTGTRRRGK